MYLSTNETIVLPTWENEDKCYSLCNIYDRFSLLEDSGKEIAAVFFDLIRLWTQCHIDT